MSDNATVTTQETAPAEEQTRTFTQDELNAIVGKRLAEEKGKYADYEELKKKAAAFDEAEEAQKSELQKATERADQLQSQLDKMLKADEIRKVREKVAAETGVPAGLLSGEDEETCKAQADGILSFATSSKPSAYPVIKDGGEVKHANAPATSEDQFKEWFEQTFN